MRVTGGHTIEVWRSSRDRFGDTVADTLVGTIENVLLDWRGPHQSGGFQETATLDMVMFVPKADVRVERLDRLKCDGVTYAVVGGRMWDEPHPVTGYDFQYYCVQVESVT